MDGTTNSAVKPRYQERAYLKVGENYELMGTGFQELNEDPGAQTTTKRYISDRSSTSSITSYEGEHPFTADQIVSEAAIKDLIDIGKNRKVGADAERELIRVDLDEAIEEEPNTFKARKFEVSAEISSFSSILLSLIASVKSLICSVPPCTAFFNGSSMFS